MTRAKDTINNQSSKYYDYTITIANNSTLFYVEVRNNTCGFVDMKYNS